MFASALFPPLPVTKNASYVALNNYINGFLAYTNDQRPSSKTSEQAKEAFELAERVRQAREHLGITQAELAKLSLLHGPGAAVVQACGLRLRRSCRGTSVSPRRLRPSSARVWRRS
jgi:hypothetical protein